MVQHADIDHTGLTGISSGSVATDSIWDAAGDLAVGSGANTAAKLPIGATNGMVVSRVSGAVAWALPPGYEFDYAQKTSNTTVTATAAGTADTIITGNAVSYDGSTAVVITFCCTFVSPPAGQDITIGIFESTTEVGRIAYLTAAGFSQVHGSLRLTPSNASHTYLIKAWVSSGSATVGGGASGAASTPAFMRITKV